MSFRTPRAQEPPRVHRNLLRHLKSYRVGVQSHRSRNSYRSRTCDVAELNAGIIGQGLVRVNPATPADRVVCALASYN